MKTKLLSILVLLCLLLSACGKDEPSTEQLYAERGDAKREALGELIPAADANTVLEALTAAGQSESARWQPEDAERERTGPYLTTGGNGTEDTVVTDGTDIYMLDSYGLVTISAAGSASELLSYTKVTRAGDRWGERLYLWQDRIAVLWSAATYDENGIWRGATETRAIVLSVADPANPVQVGTIGMDGSLVDACLIDGKLCVVTQDILLSVPDAAAVETVLPRLSENEESFTLRAGDVYLCPDTSRSVLTVAAAIGMEDARFVDALAFTDGTDAVRANGKELYLARTRWSEKRSAPREEAPYSVVDYTAAAQTEIKRLRLDDGLVLEEGCVLYGALTDPDALELCGDLLCLASEVDERSFSVYSDEAHGWTNYEGKSHVTDSQLAVLDGELNAIGALARLGGETGIRACRFLNRSAWITAGDTLSAVDLSNPKDPQIRGSFPASGEAIVLRELDKGNVLAFSLPVPGGKAELALYDLSDPAAPKLQDSRELDDLPAADLTVHGALFTDAASGLTGWAAAGKDGIEYHMVRCTDGKLKDLGAFALEYIPENARVLLLNGTLYLCSPGQVYVADPEAMKIVATVSNAVG